MKPLRIDTGALHRNRLPRLLSPKAGPTLAQLSSHRLGVNRRQLFGLTALAGLGLSPALKLVETVMASTSEEFSCDVMKTRVVFSQNGQARWVIDTSRFGGSPRLTCHKANGFITLELRHATFPGTALPADFRCELRQRMMSWEMTISFTLGSFRSRVPFEKWLAGLEPARAPVWLDEQVCTVGLGHASVSGGAQAEFFPQWTFVFQGHKVGVLQGQAASLAADRVQLALLDPASPSVVRQPEQARTLIAMERGGRTWSLTPPFHSQEGESVHCPDNAFSALHVEAWDLQGGGTANALLAESGWDDPHISISFDGRDMEQDRLALPLVGARYVSLFQSNDRKGQQAMVAKYGDDPVPFKLHGCTFSLGHPMGTPPFELVQYEDGVGTLQCEPGIHRIAVPLAGAVVQPMEVPFGSRLILAQTAPRKKIRPRLTPQIRKQPAPLPKQPILKQPIPKQPPAIVPKEQRVSPSATQQKSLAGKEVVTQRLADFRVAIQVPGPLAVSVVRPEDLLVLKFEFRNLNLQVGKGQPPKLVPVKGKSGIAGQPALVVNFPPQHIAEEAFYYASENNKDPVEFPIEARPAGWSRLVFAIPTGTPFVPYTLEALLDWSGYQQLVAPAAAPPPPPPRAVLMRVPVKPPPQRLPPRQFRRPQSIPFLDGPVEPRWNEVRGTDQPFVRARTLLAGRHRPQLILIAQQQTPRRQIRPQTEIQKQVPGALSIKSLTPSPPTQLELRNFTAIEMPFRLFLSPSHMAGWSHMKRPVVFNGRTELWHTRLGVRKEVGKGQWRVDEVNAWYRTVRAIWSPDFDKPIKLIYPPTSENPKGQVGGSQRFPCGEDRTPFRMLPEAQHRHQLVHLMANAKEFPKGWPERVMRVKRLMLSALGAWMNGRYAYEPTPAGPLTVVEWVQKTMMGRDQFVKVVEEGFLFPCGHKAVLIQVSERVFERTNKGIVAVLRYREYLDCREPEKTYPGPGQQELSSSDSRNFPFRKLRITTLTTPNLDKKENSPAFGGNPPPKQKKMFKLSKCPPPETGGGIAFWPKVDGQDFQWHLVGEDWAGQLCEFSMPMVFMTKDIGQAAGMGNASLIDGVRTHYVMPANTARRTVDLAGQECAFASPPPKGQGKSGDGDTILETSSLTFDAEIPCVKNSPCPPPQVRQPLLEAGDPFFFPFVSLAQVSVPAIKNLLGTGDASKGVKVRYSEIYRLSGFAGSNRGEIFLDLVDPVALTFGQSDKAGGVGTPNMNIVALSRSHGPVGGGGSGITSKGADPISAAKGFAEGNFDPKDFFKDAKILGGIDLGDIVKTAAKLSVAKAPKFVTERLPHAVHTTYTFQADPQKVLTQLIDFIPGLPGLASPKYKPDLVLTALIKVDIPDPQAGGSPSPPEPQFNALGVLKNFQIEFAKQLVLRFKQFRFEKKHGKKVDVAVEFSDETKGEPKGVEFKGALAFLAKLQELIPSDGLSDPPTLQVSPQGVLVGLSVAIPSVTVGVLSLTNMKFGAGLRLPFNGDPVTLRVNFCSRNDPFMGAVWIFGLTGFFAVEMNGEVGLSLVEVQIEFGGMWAFDIGVASGGVKLVAGFYFSYAVQDGIFLEGYIKIHGGVQVLGIVAISLMVKLALQYSSADDVVWGEATIAMKVEVLFFEVPVEWTCRKEIAGSSHGGSSGSAWLEEDEDGSFVYLTGYDGQASPTNTSRFSQKVSAGSRKKVRPRKIPEMLSGQDWNQYASAFADDVA